MNESLRVSPETAADTIGGVELGAGWGSGHDSEATPPSMQSPGDGCEATGAGPPQAERSAAARTRVSRCNSSCTTVVTQIIADFVWAKSRAARGCLNRARKVVRRDPHALAEVEAVGVLPVFSRPRVQVELA